MEGLAKSVGSNGFFLKKKIWNIIIKGKVYLLDISDKLINYLEKRRQSLVFNIIIINITKNSIGFKSR